MLDRESLKNTLSDEKIKKFIQLCWENESYTELTSKGLELFVLELNKKTRNLGFRPYVRGKEELHQYLSKVHEILKRNDLYFFDDALIKDVRFIERNFKKNKGKPILKHGCQRLFQHYFFLRSREVPDITKKPDLNIIKKDENFKVFSFLKGKEKEKKADDTAILRFKLEREIEQSSKALKEHYDPELFQKILHQKKLYANLENQDGKKIEIEGSLNSSWDYQASMDEFFGSLFLMGSVVCFVLAFLMLLQSMAVPNLTLALSPLTLLFVAGGIVLLYPYLKYFKEA